MRVVLILISAVLVFCLIFWIGNSLESKKIKHISITKIDSTATIQNSGYISPPILMKFNLIATGRRGENNDIDYTSATKENMSIKFHEPDKSIAFDIKTGGFTIFWVHYKIEDIKTGGTVTKGITYIGREGGGEYAEAEFFYNKNNKIEMVVARNDDGIFMFQNKNDDDNSDTKKVLEQHKDLIGHWFVPHDGVYIDLLATNDFVFNNGEEDLKGTYKISSNIISLYFNNGEQKQMQLSIQPEDGFYRLKMANYLFLNLDQINKK